MSAMSRLAHPIGDRVPPCQAGVSVAGRDYHSRRLRQLTGHEAGEQGHEQCLQHRAGRQGGDEGVGDEAEDPGQFWKDFIRDTAPVFRKPTIEQLSTFVQPTWQALIDGARYCEPQLREIVARQKPVALGDVTGDDYVVRAGLKTGERVIVSNVQKIGDGAPVKPS